MESGVMLLERNLDRNGTDPPVTYTYALLMNDPWVELGALLILSFLALILFGAIFGVRMVTQGRHWMLKSHIITRCWFPQSAKQSLRKLILWVNFYWSLYYLSLVLFFALMGIIGWLVMNIFQDKYRATILGGYFICLYCVFLFFMSFLWMSNFWSLLAWLHPQTIQIDTEKERSDSYHPERAVRRELFLWAFLALVCFTVANASFIPYGNAFSVTALIWVMVSVNSLLVVASVYFADCFVHSGADLLVELQAHCAEMNIRYGVLQSSSKLVLNGQTSPNGDPPDISATKISKALTPDQKQYLDSNIYKTSHGLTGIVLKSISRKEKSMLSGPIVIDEAAENESLNHLNRISSDIACLNGQDRVQRIWKIDEITDSYREQVGAGFLILYMLSIVVLVGHGVLYLSRTGYYVGFAQAIAIFMSDTILFVKCSRSSYRITYTRDSSYPIVVSSGLKAWIVCLLLVAARTVLIAVPQDYWFLGQCFIYTLTGIYLSYLTLGAAFSRLVSTTLRTSSRRSNAKVLKQVVPSLENSIIAFGVKGITKMFSRYCCFKKKKNDHSPTSNEKPKEDKTKNRARNCLSLFAGSVFAFIDTYGKFLFLCVFTLYISALTIALASNSDSNIIGPAPDIDNNDTHEPLKQWKFGPFAILIVFNFAFGYAMLVLGIHFHRADVNKRRRDELGFQNVNIEGPNENKWYRPACARNCAAKVGGWIIIPVMISAIGVAVVSAYVLAEFVILEAEVELVGTVATLYPALIVAIAAHSLWTRSDFTFIKNLPAPFEKLKENEERNGRKLTPNQIKRWSHRIKEQREDIWNRNVIMIVSVIIVFSCIVGWGFVLTYEIGASALVSAVLPCALLSILSGFLAAQLWFNTFGISPSFTALILLFIATTAIAVVGGVRLLDAQKDGVLVILGFVVCLFPSFILIVVGMLLWRDNQSKFNASSLFCVILSNLGFLAVTVWAFFTSTEYGLTFLFIHVIVVSSVFLWFWWRSSTPAFDSREVPLLKKVIFVAFILTPPLVLWILAGIETPNNEYRGYFMFLGGYFIIILYGAIYVVARHKVYSRQNTILCPTPVPFGFPVIAYKVEHHGGELFTSNRELLIVIGLLLSVQFFGIVTSFQHFLDGGVALSSLSICLVAVLAVHMSLRRYSRFRDNLAELDRSVGLGKAFEIAQQEAVDRCLQISQQAMMGIWLKDKNKNAVSDAARKSFHYRASQLHSWSHSGHHESSSSEMVITTVDDLVKFHEQKLVDNSLYDDYCRDSANYRALFHIMFWLVMKQHKMTDPKYNTESRITKRFTREKILEKNNIRTPRTHRKSINIAEEKQNLDITIETIENISSDEIANPSPPNTMSPRNILKDANHAISGSSDAGESAKDIRVKFKPGMGPLQSASKMRKMVSPWGTTLQIVNEGEDRMLFASESEFRYHFGIYDFGGEHKVLIDPENDDHRKLVERENDKVMQMRFKTEPKSFNYSNEHKFAPDLGRSVLAKASNSTVRRQLLFAEFQKETTGMMWEDLDFPATNGSLYLDWDDEDEYLIAAQEEEDLTAALWCRPYEMLELVPETVFSLSGTDAHKGGRFDPKEVIQGGVGDCWLLSALSVVALRPELIDNIIVDKKINDYGLYHIRLFLDGKWCNILLDDRFPCHLDRSLKVNKMASKAADGNWYEIVERPPEQMEPKRPDEGENVNFIPFPQYCRSRSGTVLWAMLIEKAYAKYLGCYEALEGGHVHTALVDLTGGFSQIYSLRDDVELVASGALWNKLKEYAKKNALLAAGSPARDVEGNETEDDGVMSMDENGIVHGHAYSILKVTEEHDYSGHHRLLQLRDPWGVAQWSGDWSRHDYKRWTRRMQKRLNYRPEGAELLNESNRFLTAWSRKSRNHDDVSTEKSSGNGISEKEREGEKNEEGTFWISLNDFVRHFKWLYVCQLFNNDEWTHQSVEGAWVGESAGGPPNQPGARFNPQFTIKFTPTKSTGNNILLFISITNLTSIEEIRRERHLDDLEVDSTYSSGDEFKNEKQATKRINYNRTYPFMSLLLLDIGGKALDSHLVATQVVASTGKFKDTRELSFETKLPRSNEKTYTLFPSLYPKGEEGRFLINVYSRVPFKLKPLSTEP